MTQGKIGWVFAMVMIVAGSAFGQIYLHPNDNNDTNYSARRAAIDAAQGQVDRAQALLDAASARIRANWQANGEMLAAETDLKARQTAFDAASKPVLAKLEEDPKYTAARAAALRADAEVQQAHPTTGTATQPISSAAVAAATEKLNHKSALHAIEQQALAADPTVAKAQADLDASRQKLDALNLKFKAVLMNDPDYKSAFDQLNTAKANLTAAAGQY